MMPQNYRHNQIIRTYLQIANTYGQLSYANKRKVGCVIEEDNNIISIAYNGTPAGFSNKCETDEHIIENGVCIKCAIIYNNIDSGNYLCSIESTLPQVLHAESNALMKLTRSSSSCKNGNLYITYYPCFECAKLIISANIKRIYVLDDVFKNIKGTNFSEFSAHQKRSRKSEELFILADIDVSCYDEEYCIYRKN